MSSRLRPLTTSLLPRTSRSISYKTSIHRPSPSPCRSPRSAAKFHPKTPSSASSPALLLTRTMSSSDPAARPAITAPPPGKFEFLVVVPDKPGTQAKRLAVRPKHFDGLKPFIDSGAFKVGGAILNEVPEGSDATKWDFAGSTLVMIASSKEECKEILSKDVYTTSGVWDIDNVQIWPVKLAFRYP